MAERRNQTLLDMVRPMMSFIELPLSFSGYALETAATTRFISYSKQTARYYFYDPSKQKVFVSRNAVFLERGFPVDTRRDELLLEESSEAPQLNVWTSSAPTISTDNAPVLHGLARVPQPPERYGFLVVIGQLDNDPKTYGKAMSDIDLEKWLEAIKSKMNSMSSNQVWTLVDRLKGVKAIGCKWVYKRKIGADGDVTTFKARLVAKGYTQRLGNDFEETFSPVAIAKSIQIMLAIVTWYDHEIWQMDMKMTFLNNFVEKDLYGSARVIHGSRRRAKVARGYDFVKNDFGPCVYKKISGSSIAFLVLYVDNILLIGNDVKILGDTKAWVKLSKQQSPKTDEELKKMLDVPYASAVGNIQYVAQCTRPNVAYALSVMSRYLACAGEPHWTAVKSILKYLRRTKDMFLIYGGGELILEDYSNSSKQDTTTNYTMEAEYIAASEAAKEAVWIKNYIQGYGA
ncbi:Retrovirus-related Pol polyprotein from transposon TNT 1-94 [Sesamum angolense]|uniref:Retrovirus-related Pol polyprotein from transposon TNT 1-94 n=1 Tax=Sesamum angolense TaxID=2727404 RepID=A0AAE1X7H7_9LAMI|nr:Retrovirus-related Pol polyprotein from transposon TNT 1-94 [Sesamum angolense]